MPKKETTAPNTLLKTLMTSTIVMLLITAGFNIAIDPTGEWPGQMLRPLVRTSREAKVKLLKKQNQPPETLVLGSSRVMKFEPKFISKYLKGPVFNASVNSAMTEDYWAMLKYAIDDQKAPLKHIVLGVDVEAFSNARPMDARLLATPQLVKYLHEPSWKVIQRWFKRFSQALSLPQLKLSWRSLKFWLNGYPELASRYENDGFLIYIKWESQRKNGTLDTKKLLDKNKARYVDRMKGYNEIDSKRIEYFRRFVELCQSQNIKIIAFITPLHPELEAHIEQKNKIYKELKQKVHQHLKMYSAQKQLLYVDTRHIEAFNGIEGEYYDGAHPTVINTRKHIKYLLTKKAD